MIDSSAMVGLDGRAGVNATTACWIYKGTKRDEMYLYVDREDDFERVPPALLSALGELRLVMALELHPKRTLARANVRKVIDELNQQGFYLQMPPANITPSDDTE